MEIGRFKKACDDVPGSRQSIRHQHATQARHEAGRNEEHQHQDDGQARRRRSQESCRSARRLVGRRGSREPMARRMRARVVGIQRQGSRGGRGGGRSVVAGDHDEVMHAHQAEHESGDERQPQRKGPRRHVPNYASGGHAGSSEACGESPPTMRTRQRWGSATPGDRPPQGLFRRRLEGARRCEGLVDVNPRCEH